MISNFNALRRILEIYCRISFESVKIKEGHYIFYLLPISQHQYMMLHVT